MSCIIFANRAIIHRSIQIFQTGESKSATAATAHVRSQSIVIGSRKCGCECFLPTCSLLLPAAYVDVDTVKSTVPAAELDASKTNPIDQSRTQPATQTAKHA
jgi:hypothetical protein